MARTVIIVSIILIALCTGTGAGQSAPPAPERTLQFAGYTWEVRAGDGGPGPNQWSAQNVWVDAKGYLHLKLSSIKGKWYAAELSTTQRLGFGTYQWQLIGRVDQLDPNVVLGLFTYPTADVGPDGTNEIDIEFARWGNAAWPNLNYTVWPARQGPTPQTETSEAVLMGNASTHRFTWHANKVFFQSLHGHTSTNPTVFHQWTFTSRQPQREIPQQSLPVHMNLWLVDGQPPTNGQPVEIVIRTFTYTPAKTTPAAATEQPQ